MMKRVVYLIGIPGAGKTACLDAALVGLGWGVYPARETPFAHEPLIPEKNPMRRPVGFYLGRHRIAFSGTDALPMGVQPTVITWLRREGPDLVIGEGDRLGNRKFFLAVRDLGYDLDVIHLSTPLPLAAQRRAQCGRHQDERWIKGRITKVDNLAREWATYVVDGSASREVVAEEIAEVIRVGFGGGI